MRKAFMDENFLLHTKMAEELFHSLSLSYQSGRDCQGPEI